MFRFICNRLKIEQGDLDDRTLAKIFVRFTITENGELEDIKVMKGISDKVDKKVVRIFEEMPNWNPAYLYGKPIRQRYIYPINIDLE